MTNFNTPIDTTSLTSLDTPVVVAPSFGEPTTTRQLAFLCGALRSGTSLTHLMLDGHPLIKNPGEFDFLFDALSESGEPPTAEAYKTFLSNDRVFGMQGLTIGNGTSFQELVDDFIDQISSGNGWVVLNVHRNFHHITKFFPDAKIIHLVRDPRDVSRSSIGMGWVGHVRYGVDHWIDTENSWDQAKPQLAENQFTELSFEELIAEPQLTLERICSLLDVDYTDQMISQLQGTTYSEPDVSLINQWKRKLSDREIELVEQKVSHLMKDRGYKLASQSVKKPSAFESFRIWLRNKVYRQKFAINRYGLKLYLIDRILSRIGTNKAYAGFQRLRQEIDTQNCK